MTSLLRRSPLLFRSVKLFNRLLTFCDSFMRNSMLVSDVSFNLLRQLSPKKSDVGSRLCHTAKFHVDFKRMELVDLELDQTKICTIV